MKFAEIERVKALRNSGMRKKDKEYWGGSGNYNVWLCWMSVVIEWLEKKREKKFGTE